jgi:hypothetical protein
VVLSNVGLALLASLLNGFRVKVFMTHAALAELGFPFNAVMI